MKVADSVIIPSADGVARMITNCLGMPSRAKMGMEVRVATLEVIDPPQLDFASLLVKISKTLFPGIPGDSS